MQIKPFVLLSLALFQGILTDSPANPGTFLEETKNKPTNQLAEPIFLNPFENENLNNQTAIQNTSEAKLGEKYQIPTDGIYLHGIRELLDKHEKLVLLFQGNNSLTVQVIQDEGKFSLMSVNVSVDDRAITVLPVDKSILMTGGNMSLKVSKHFQLDCFVEFLITDDFDLTLNSTYKVQANMSGDLNFRIKNIYQKVIEKPENRLQFIVRTSVLKQQIRGVEYLSMKINANKKVFPDEKNYDMSASGNVGLGLVKTINQDSPFYCKSEDCEYRITIKSLNIEHIYFFPSIVENNAEFTFQNNINVVEELQPEEEISYFLKIPSEISDWSIRIVPENESPQFFVSFDKKPKNLKNSFFVYDGGAPMEFLLTKEQQNKLNLQIQIVVVTFKNTSQKNSNAFQFHMEKQQPNLGRGILQNFTHVGRSVQNEIINYKLDLYQDEPHINSIIIQLDSQQGEMELFVKECQNQNDCIITDQDTRIGGDTSFIRKGVLSQSQSQNGVVTSSKILLNVNCLGLGLVTKKELNISSAFVKSHFCKFVIGIKGQQTDKEGATYQLSTQGQEIAHPLKLRTSHHLTIQKKEKEYYYIESGEGRMNKNIKIRVIVLIGKAKLYFSNFQKKPNSEDFDTQMDVKSGGNEEITSNIYWSEFHLADNNTDGRIYIGIEGDHYSVIDLYVIPEDEMILEENVEIEQVLKRELIENDIFQFNNEKFYQKLFKYTPEDEQLSSEKFYIHVGSSTFGLQICVQPDSDFNTPLQCQYQSNTGKLEIPRKNWNSITFAIRKVIKQNEYFVNFPIEFDVRVSSDSKLSMVSLHESGKIHSNKIQPDSKVIYQINLTSMSNKFMILLQTDHSSIHAEVYGNREMNSIIGTLDRNTFGYQEYMGQEFKSKFCKSKNCFLYVHINNKAKESVDYSLIYTIDKFPIHLHLGKEIFVPSAIQTTFVTPIDKTKSTSFHFYSETASLLAVGNLYEQSKFKEKSIYNYISEYRFQYKSKIDKSEELVILAQNQQEFQKPNAIFQLIPKFDFEINPQQVKSGLLTFERVNLVRVSLHQGNQKLEPFKEENATLSKGDFNIYSLSLENEEGFSLFLTIHTGKAQLFLNRGFNNPPTTTHYWKKISSVTGGEIIIDKKMLDGEKEFTASIFANEETKLSLNFLPQFDNIINLKYQNLVEKRLKKGQVFYFDYYNQKDVFESILYASGSDLEVSVMEYQKLHGQDFLTVMKDESNYLQKFTFKKGDVPRKRMSQVTLDQKAHYVVRMKALDGDAKIFFILYNSKMPIKVPSRHQFYFTLDKDSTQLFEIQLGSNYEEIDVDCKLVSGAITFSVSDDLNFNDKKSLKGHHHGHLKYLVRSKPNDLVVFNSIYLKVDSTEQSSFKCRVLPKGEFLELNPFEVEMVKIDAQNEKFVYFNIEDSFLKRKFHLHIYLEEGYKKPELLFSGDQNIQMDAEQSFLPMPMDDLSENLEDNVRHLQVHPNSQKGSFIVKFSKPNQDQIVKIALTLDNTQIIEPNCFFRTFSPSNQKAEYSIYLPEAGEFRILPDTCAGVQVGYTSFQSKHENREITFEDNYAQAYSFLYIDERNQGGIVRDYKNLILPVRRGFVDNPGVLRFQTQKSSGESQYSYLLTEFRPREKELILKDYIDLWGDQEEMKSLQQNLNFDKKEKSLKVSILSPKFKQQLLQDYPDLKSVRLQYKVFILKDPSFYEKFMSCGFNAIQFYEHISKKIEIHYDRERIMGKRDDYSIHFEESFLGSFYNQKYLSFFSKMEFSIIEKEEDLFNIGVNRKFTNVPFFFMTVKNDLLIDWHFKELIVIGLVLLFALILFKKMKKSTKNFNFEDDKKYTKNSNEYEHVQKNEFSDIEMY